MFFSMLRRRLCLFKLHAQDAVAAQGTCFRCKTQCSKGRRKSNTEFWRKGEGEIGGASSCTESICRTFLFRAACDSATNGFFRASISYRMHPRLQMSVCTKFSHRGNIDIPSCTSLSLLIYSCHMCTRAWLRHVKKGDKCSPQPRTTKAIHRSLCFR